MKWNVISLFTVLLLVLGGCQGTDDAQRSADQPNIDPTTNRNTMDRANNDQDYMLEREGNRTGQQFNRNDRMGNRMNDDRDSRFEVAEEAAERITDEIDEIENVYVLTMGNTAYVAANFDHDDRNRNHTDNRNRNRDGDDDISDEMKDRIGEIVRSVDRDIENVYVSTNPDFLDLANNYANDVDRGRPIGGFFDQINEMIERVFPENTDRRR